MPIPIESWSIFLSSVFFFHCVPLLLACARNVECLSPMRYHEYLLKYELFSILKYQSTINVEYLLLNLKPNRFSSVDGV